VVAYTGLFGSEAVAWAVMQRRHLSWARVLSCSSCRWRRLACHVAPTCESSLDAHRLEPVLRAFRQRASARRNDGPGARGRGEVQVKAWVLLEPGSHVRMLVGGVVVEDHVYRQLFGHLAVDHAEEVQELNVAVSRQTLAGWVQELKVLKANQKKARLGSELWQDTGYVFTTSIGSPFDPRNVAERFQTACTRAGIGKWHPHELRHTAASLMLAEGVPLQVVSSILGHASIRITSDVYGHVLAPQRRQVAETLASVLAP